MLKKLLPLVASLASLPLLSLAQAGAGTPRFYVGAGAALLSNVPFNSVGVPTLVGPALTAGMQLTPRLAVQVSGAYHWQSTSYSTGTYSSSSASFATTTYSEKYVTLPVLLRYTFTEPAARFHFDGLAGVTVLHGSFRSSTVYPPGYASYYYMGDYASSSTRANATLGPAVRFSLTPRVDLAAASLVNVIIGDNYRSFSDRLFLNTFLGVHYTFGEL